MAENAIVPYEINALTKVSQKKKTRNKTKSSISLMVRTERYLKIRLHENMLLFISFFNINSSSTA